ncbi:MAG: metal-dependent hydrolase [Marinobacter sp.]|nr:metal-dependent hydrolase [Marinobacter sp.]
MTEIRHTLKGRPVQFDLQQTPLHWIPGDVFSTHLINAIHILLPEGELWFCRVYNQALPLVTDPQLREDVQGFIHQEAIHARAHTKAQDYLRQHDMDIEQATARVRWLFRDLLGDNPLGQTWLANAATRKHWLVMRVGIIAAIEHFTGCLGQWAMDSKGWDDADPVMADLFRWHLAEEVEHRTVAFDLFEHLCQTQLGFYASRQALMALVFPLFVAITAEVAKSLARQDSDPQAQIVARWSLPRFLRQMERAGNSSDHVPAFSVLVRATLRWLSPSFHPQYEGNTEQALAYIARSPAAQAAH